MNKYFIIFTILANINSGVAAELVADSDTHDKLEVIKVDIQAMKNLTEEFKSELQQTKTSIANIEEVLDMQEFSGKVTDVTEGYSSQQLFNSLHSDRQPDTGKKEHNSEFDFYNKQKMMVNGLLYNDQGKISLIKRTQKDIIRAAYIYSILIKKRAKELEEYDQLIGQANNMKEMLDLNNKLLIALIAERQISNLVSSLDSLERVLKRTTVNTLN